jgi:Fic family protein
VQKQLVEVDQQRAQIEAQKPLKPELWSAIQQKLRVDWTYDSNALEGSSLTRGETLFFLQEGLTVEGKPFKDFLDARNHAEAIDFVYQVVQEERPITPGLLKEINALLLSGITHTETVNEDGHKVKKPVRAGEYKRLPNHVLQPDGTIHFYVDPLQVPNEIEILCTWIQEKLPTTHALIVAARAHYNFVRIHPFDDGNGRGARLLMNLILIRKRYPPAIIRREERRRYLETLAQADQGNLEPFLHFITASLLQTQTTLLQTLPR